MLLFVNEDASEAQARILAGAFSGLFGGPLCELGQLLGELIGIERVPIEVELAPKRAKLSVGRYVETDTQTHVGPDGEPTTLSNAQLSNVLGTPAYVGESRRLKLALQPQGVYCKSALTIGRLLRRQSQRHSPRARAPGPRRCASCWSSTAFIESGSEDDWTTDLKGET